MPGSRQLGVEDSLLDEGLCPTDEHELWGQRIFLEIAVWWPSFGLPLEMK
jgi:hypothetical protein